MEISRYICIIHRRSEYLCRIRAHHIRTLCIEAHLVYALIRFRIGNGTESGQHAGDILKVSRHICRNIQRTIGASVCLRILCLQKAIQSSAHQISHPTIMIIYNAERFGLSQLHQLRGRVGRGAEKSYCFLLQGTEGETARERLLTLKNNTDGFKIAEKDLEMRGSGDFFGTRQSGKMLTDIKNLRYPTSVIFTAKKMSDDAFLMGLADERVRDAAIRKYERLKDVVLN